MFILVSRNNRVFAYPGDDVTLTSHLSPETSAVTMEIRWFRGIECIYLYKTGQVMVAKAYEGRVSLLTQELQIGNVSLILRDVGPGDTGIYGCQVIAADNKMEKSIHLYMAGMDPLSSDRWGSRITQQNDLDMEESVHALEMKKLLHQKQLELEACKKEVERLGLALQEKDGEVGQLGWILQGKEQELAEVRKHRGEAEEELRGRTKELERTMEELRRMSGFLQGRLTDLEGMGRAADEREAHMRSMAGELETCKRELSTLGLKLQEESGRAQELSVIVRDREQELEEAKKQREQRAENRGRPSKAAMSNGCFDAEPLDERDGALTAMCRNPNYHLAEVEQWICKKREERRQKEEAEMTEVLEQEFLDYIEAQKRLLEREQEKIVASAVRMANLEKTLECTETAEDRSKINAQLGEALERCREAQNEVQQLTKEIDQRRSEIEQRHTHKMEEIRERYEGMPRLEAERNLLQIILSDVLAYFKRIPAETRGTFEMQMEKEMQDKCKPAGEKEKLMHRRVTDRVENEGKSREDSLGDWEEDGLTEESVTEVKVMEQRAEAGRETDESSEESPEHEDLQTQADPELDGELDQMILKNGGIDSEGEETDESEESSEMVNGLVIGDEEPQAVMEFEEEEEGREEREVVEEAGQGYEEEEEEEEEEEQEEDINDEDYSEQSS